MSKSKNKKKIEGKVTIPKEISPKLSGNTLELKGQKGEQKKNFDRPYISIELKDNEIIFKATLFADAIVVW